MSNKSHFTLFTGLQYLKIDIANNFGKDKLSYKQRLNWFDNNIKPKVRKNNRDDYIYKLVCELEPEEPELALMGVFAYRDYLNQKESGYLVSFDATASGIQLMSALTTDVNGMYLTNLIVDERIDCYTAIYGSLVQVWYEKYKEQLNITRKNIKQAIMVMMYGGKESMLKHIDNNPKIYTELLEVCKNSINGAYRLCEALLYTVDPNATEYSWVTPDGFHVHKDIMVQYKEERDSPIGRIQIKYKDKGTVNNYKGNVANLIHSLDGTLMREVVARCNYNKNDILGAISKIDRILKMSGPEFDALKATIGTEMNSELDRLVDIYLETNFVSVRMLKYIHKNSDVLGLILKTNVELINKLYKLAEKMLSYNNFEIVVLHDCFKALPNNMNYVRYWYKEVLADMVETNVFRYMMKQLPHGETIYDLNFKDRQPKVHTLIRNSNYAIC